MNNDVDTEGEFIGGGLARVLPQRLFGEVLTVANEVKKIYFSHTGLPRLRPYWCDGLSRHRAPIQRTLYNALETAISTPATQTESTTT